ncbi:8362_t:CDS:1 [Entrophospora sp. SA101]|nr:8362_t:CDS:1 [Entrophospora sp. SA101]
MSSILGTPEILENIFSYLPTNSLVRLTYVNKLWRLEARHKLYQNRTEIIYKTLKWFLSTFRIYGEMHSDLRFQCTQSLIKVTKFQLAFNINLRTELFIIRNQLKVQYKAIKAKCAVAEKNYLEANELFYADPGNVDKYALARRLEFKHAKLDDYKSYVHRDLINFEYFLVRYNYIVNPDEINCIYDKCIF